jgi:hypothetical protein
MSIKKYLRLGSRKRIPTEDNTIGRMWTNGMSYLHETRMKKSGMLRTLGDSDCVMTSM